MLKEQCGIPKLGQRIKIVHHLERARTALPLPDVSDVDFHTAHLSVRMLQLQQSRIQARQQLRPCRPHQRKGLNAGASRISRALLCARLRRFRPPRRPNGL